MIPSAAPSTSNYARDTIQDIKRMLNCIPSILEVNTI